MKEDILEQLVDEYLMHQGYFTMHNVKFRPDVGCEGYDSKQDSVSSDIDVIGIHPGRIGADRVVVVSCKSWQGGLDPLATIRRIENSMKSGGRDEWRKYRELCAPKWSAAFLKAIERATGSSEFTYWTAITKLAGKGHRSDWENYLPFREAIAGNPIRLISLSEMLDDVWEQLSTTPAATELGRMMQLMKASRWMDLRKKSA